MISWEFQSCGPLMEFQNDDRQTNGHLVELSVDPLFDTFLIKNLQSHAMCLFFL